MKRFSQILFALLFSAAMASSCLAATSIKATVHGMVCAFCAQGIEKRLSKLAATQAVFVDLKQKVVAVEAKEGQTLDAKTINDEITDAGYAVVKLETVALSVAEIKAATKAASQTKK